MRTILSIAVLALALSFVGCSDERPGIEPNETQFQKLSGSWRLISASDGREHIAEYKDVVVTFSGTYEENGIYSFDTEATSWPALSPWKASSAWAFSDGNGKQIVRMADDVQMQIQFLDSDNRLEIAFDYGKLGYVNSRSKSLSGNWVFVFARS